MLLRPRQILAPIIFATVFGYFGYHLVNGDRGLLAMVHLQREVLVAEQNLTEAETTRKIWERRVAALRNQSLDPDMLDERARAAELLAQGRHRHLHTDPLGARRTRPGRVRDALIRFASRPPETNCPVRRGPCKQSLKCCGARSLGWFFAARSTTSLKAML